MEDDGQDNPLRREPELPPDLQLFWDAFQSLKRHRRFDFDGNAMSISCRELESWARVHRLDDQDLIEELWYLTQALDAKDRALHQERKDQQRQKAQRVRGS